MGFFTQFKRTTACSSAYGWVGSLPMENKPYDGWVTCSYGWAGKLDIPHLSYGQVTHLAKYEHSSPSGLLTHVKS